MGLETDPAVVGSKIKLARIPFEWDLLLLDKIHHTPASSVYRLNQGPWVQTGSQHEGIWYSDRPTMTASFTITSMDMAPNTL